MASSSKDPSGGGGRRKEGEKNRRLLSAKPAKVNTTREDQCKLAEVLREMGVICKACLLQGPFCHKSHDSGPTCYKYKISTGSATSTGRNCDLRRGGEVAMSMTASRPSEGAGDEPVTRGQLDLSRNMCALRQKVASL